MEGSGAMGTRGQEQMMGMQRRDGKKRLVSLTGLEGVCGGTTPCKGFDV